jgi:hypothetical protein
MSHPSRSVHTKLVKGRYLIEVVLERRQETFENLFQEHEGDNCPFVINIATNVCRASTKLFDRRGCRYQSGGLATSVEQHHEDITLITALSRHNECGAVDEETNSRPHRCVSSG